MVGPPGQVELVPSWVPDPLLKKSLYRDQGSDGDRDSGRRVTAARELTCEDVAPVIHAYAFGRLAECDAAPVGQHLPRCANCQSIVEEIGRDTAEVLAAAGFDELPEDLVDLIIAAAAEAAETPGGGRADARAQ